MSAAAADPLVVRLARELVDMDLSTAIDLSLWPTAARLVETLTASGDLWDYQIGDPDPWSGHYRLICGRPGDGHTCTAPALHDGPHIATHSGRVVAVWDDPDDIDPGTGNAAGQPREGA